jgi:hypothetical protein
LIKEIALSLLNGAICLPFCLQAAIFIRRATYYWFCDLLCFTICNYYCFLNGFCAFVIR